MGVGACGDVGHRNADSRGLLRSPVDRKQPALPLDQQIIGLVVAIGAVLAVARDRAIDQARMPFRQGFGAEPQPIGGAGGEVLDEDVGARGHGHDQCKILGLLHVEADRFLAAIQPDEIGALALDEMVVTAREISLRPLDLDNPRPRVGKPSRGERRRDRLLERDDEKAVQIRHFDSLQFFPQR